MIIPFEDKIRMLDHAEKYHTGKLIDQLLAERHGRKHSAMPNDEEKTPHILRLLKE
jgi:hypothetical protein